MVLGLENPDHTAVSPKIVAETESLTQVAWNHND